MEYLLLFLKWHAIACFFFTLYWYFRYLASGSAYNPGGNFLVKAIKYIMAFLINFVSFFLGALKGKKENLILLIVSVLLTALSVGFHF